MILIFLLHFKQQGITDTGLGNQEGQRPQAPKAQTARRAASQPQANSQQAQDTFTFSPALLQYLVFKYDKEAKAAAEEAINNESPNQNKALFIGSVGGGIAGEVLAGSLALPVWREGVLVAGGVVCGMTIASITNRNMTKATYAVTYNETFAACYKRERGYAYFHE